MTVVKDDVAFMKDQDQWPCWPHLPVKKNTGKGLPLCGVVFPNQPTVRILNMFAGWTPETFDAAQKFEYKSFEDLVADGWMVD